MLRHSKNIKAKYWSKSKKPVNEVRQVSGSHAPSSISESGLPLQAAVLVESGCGNTNDTVPAVAQQASPKSNAAASDLPVVNKPDKAVPGDAKRSRNLWEEAFKKLDQDKKDLLSKLENSQGPKVIEQVADQAEKSYREHEERGWKISRGEGKPDINVRAVFKKAFLSILKFKEMIAAGVAFDPTGHASAAWTIVSLGLRMTQTDAEMRKDVVDTCEKLTDTLILMAAIEASYRDRTLPDSEHLEDIIIVVYVAILELSAEIVRENSLNIGQRVLESFTALSEQPLHDFIETLRSKEATLMEWTKIIEHQYRTQEMEGLSDKVTSTVAGIEELARQVSKVAIKILTAEEQRILDWLCTYSFSDSHVTAASRREPDTGTWIFTSPEYVKWKTSANSLLWLYGNSGFGKSILCSSIIDDIEKLCSPPSISPVYTLAFWYFTFRSVDSVNLNSLFSSIIRQLCARAQTLPQSVRDLETKHHTAGSRPTRAELIQTLDTVVIALRGIDQHAFVVLDALDEYPRPEREEVLIWLQHFCKKHANAHILITSRDEADIRKCFGEDATLDVARGVTNDVDLFVRRCIKRITKDGNDWKDEYRLKIHDRMTGVSEKYYPKKLWLRSFPLTSGRRFRWVALVAQRFQDCIDDEMMEVALHKLPETLEGLYADFLRQIPKAYQKKARLVFMWLTYSIWPLTLAELASAVSIPNPEDVLRMCSSALVSLQRKQGDQPKQHHKISEDVVKLDHFSVKEYLSSGDLLAADGTAYFHVTPLVAHLTIAEISVSHLLETNEAHREAWKNIKATRAKDRHKKFKPPGEDPLLEYSTIWFKHVQNADAIFKRPPESKTSGLEDQLAVAKLETESLRAQCHRVFTKEYSQSLDNWFCLLVIYDILPLHAFLLGSWPVSPMVVASLFDLPDNVRRLLGNGANVDGDVYPFYFLAPWWIKPVHDAAVEGHLEVLRILLENNASLDQSDLDEVARQSKRHGVAVLSTILEARPDLAIKNETAINSAKNWDSTEMLDYILNKADLMTETLFVEIVKECFFSYGNEDLVRKLLKRGDELGCKSDRMLKTFLRGSRCGEMNQIVLDRYKPNPEMKQNVLKWVLVNESGLFVWRALPVVLSYYRDIGIEVEFTQYMLSQVASSKYSAQLFGEIVRYAKNIDITMNVLKRIAYHSRSRARGTITKLLDCNTLGRIDYIFLDDSCEEHFGSCKVKADEVIKAAASWEPKTIKLLQAHARPNVKFIKTLTEAESSDLDEDSPDSDADSFDTAPSRSDAEQSNANAESFASDA